MLAAAIQTKMVGVVNSNTKNLLGLRVGASRDVARHAGDFLLEFCETDVSKLHETIGDIARTCNDPADAVRASLTASVPRTVARLASR